MFRLKKNLLRTFIAGMLALLALCYALVSILEIPFYDMLLLVGTGVVIVAVLGFAGFFFGYLLFRLRRSGDKNRMHPGPVSGGPRPNAKGRASANERDRLD